MTGHKGPTETQKREFIYSATGPGAEREETINQDAQRHSGELRQNALRDKSNNKETGYQEPNEGIFQEPDNPLRDNGNAR